MQRTKVVCPDCGPQEYRAHMSPVYVHRDPETGDFARIEYSGKSGVTRFSDDDDTCPKCGSETLPQAAAESALALLVRTKASKYSEVEEEAVERRRSHIERRGLRVVVG